MKLTSTNRRHFLKAMSLGGLFYAERGAFADALVLTPEQTIGPYYPDRMPLDLDNDLLVINDAINPGIGSISWVSGRVLDRNGSPVRGALVEIWQADNNGAYIHSASPIANRDVNFQGYGKFLTGSNGAYLFRTVKPGLYPGRTRHIHFAITAPARSRFTTQLYVKGETRNANDGVLNGIRDATERSSVIVPWNAVEGSAIGELSASFDIVMGYTAVEDENPARPTLVAVGAVVHGATNEAGGAESGWVTIFGDGLAPNTRQWDASEIIDGKLPASLDGVSVQIGNQPAAVSYISPKQINVQAPSGIGTAAVDVTVTNSNGTSDPAKAAFHGIMPGLFLGIDEYVSAVRGDGTLLSAEIPAKPGDIAILYGTGFGPSTPEIASGEEVREAVPLANSVKIQIDTLQAQVASALLTGPGTYRFEILVPDLADGDHSVSVEVAGVRSGKTGRLRVRSYAG